MENIKGHIPSEMRYDPAAREWVVIATGRARRPDLFSKKEDTSSLACSLENLEIQERPMLMMFHGAVVDIKENEELPKDWTCVSFPNKYPAFSLSGGLSFRTEGPYTLIDGIGFHEVVVTKDHTKDIADFTFLEIQELLAVYQKRFQEFQKAEFVQYISIFKNKGTGAGASIIHPHSQIIAIPVLDPEIQGSLDGSKEYFKKNKSCVHCDMISFDREERFRVVYENEQFVAVCPFASATAFELRIYPLEHSSRFEETKEEGLAFFADALGKVLRMLKGALKDPDYNYFIHTAPVNGKEYPHYHWHMEILPKTAQWAGFELGTGIPISTIDPKDAAAFLRTHG